MSTFILPTIVFTDMEKAEVPEEDSNYNLTLGADVGVLIEDLTAHIETPLLVQKIWR